MSMAMLKRIKAVEGELNQMREFKSHVEQWLKSHKPGEIVQSAPVVPHDFESKIQNLEHKYRMLNARLNKKNNIDAETDGNRASGAT